MSLEVGAIVEGEVTGITNFGAFVQLPEGKVGLIHISEVSNVYVKDVHDFLKEKDKVKVKVLSIDERGKIGLSIKQLTPPPPAPPKPQRPVSQERRAPKVAPPVSFEDKLSRFLKDSDDRLLDLKRNTESKRGGRGACSPQAEVMEHKINRQREQCRGAGDHDGMDLPRIFRNPQPQHHHQGDQRKQRKYIHSVRIIGG